jgi:hypothetical protein
MPVREVARFASLPEAEVACSALLACGFHAVLPDRYQLTTLWTHQLAFGDFRLWVPEEEFAEATALVGECRAADRAAVAWTKSPGVVTGLAWALLALISGEAGWAVGLIRRRFTFIRTAVVLAPPAAYVAAAAMYYLFPPSY